MLYVHRYIYTYLPKNEWKFNIVFWDFICLFKMIHNQMWQLIVTVDQLPLLILQISAQHNWLQFYVLAICLCFSLNKMLRWDFFTSNSARCKGGNWRKLISVIWTYMSLLLRIFEKKGDGFKKFGSSRPFVLRKRCSENMLQIYRRTATPKCDFNNAAKELYWNYTSAWVVFPCIFATYFQNIFSLEHL